MKLNAIGLVVQDMVRSIEFYRRLGLDFPAGAVDEVHAETTLSGGLRLMLDSAKSIRGFDPNWSPPSGSPRVSLAFECAGSADVDRRYQELVAGGAAPHKPPWDAVWGQRYAMLRDPDGNGIDLYASLR